jgi:hypothetical protein
MRELWLRLTTQDGVPSGTSRPLVPTLIAVAAAVFVPLFRRLFRSLTSGARRSTRILFCAALLVFGTAGLAVYWEEFRELTFPPPTILHGLGLIFIISIPVILVIAGAAELWVLLVESSDGESRASR